ncbi:DNA-binding protein [Trametes coccinea BRFM310]|uniref:DNA-binding protein n=1 Tax=Trametes coccinea (strain BRFM310) TaxID=1353009 RepID=A0A1Y2J524_TRAC3|nr:DNA-binding protein [Trametes coccinea BRFM310]
MQAQAIRTDRSQAVITSQQSLQSIQTLLRAGLGCITYLRNLLPSDNFSESYLTSSAPDALSSQPSMNGNSFASSEGRRNVSGFKIMTVTRGFTEEADRLMDYLESGIFDALQKQYLRSFVFAIYLDDQDPNSIVEAYTFNFSYCKVPGSNAAVPVMSLGEDMMNLSLSGSRRSQDPVADAARRGKVPTLGEVKRSLKALIKNLIQATTQMDALPRRRFATFKLFYYENTPEDYEPPHFRAGDAKRDKWFMSTHERGEVPERCSIGSVQTGYHGVDVKVTSVSGYLPSGEDNNAPFSGTMTGNPFGVPPLTPSGEAAMRVKQIEAQRQDALERRVVWDGDEGLLDAEQKTDTANARPNAPDNLRPVGIRDVEGNVVPLEEAESPVPGTDKSEAQYAGRAESVPLCIGELAKSGQQPGEEVSPTQELEETQIVPSDRASVALSQSPSRDSTPTPMPRSDFLRRKSDLHAMGSSLPPSDIEVSSSLDVDIPESIDTQMIKDIIMQGASIPQADSMILDMETQRLPELQDAEDPIESFSAAGKLDPVDDRDVSMERDSASAADIVECECGVQVEDCDTCVCDGGCGRWYHLWCMGYHSAQDPRIPPKFICFDCRVRADRNWDLIVVHDLYPRMIARFKDLAIQRRGIKVFETHAPKGLSEFTKLIDCDSTVAGQVFKRLEAEGFIAQNIRETDESGFLETTTRASKRKARSKATTKGKAGQNRKTLQKPVYVFVQAIKNDDVYKDYFNPEPEVEKRLLGLSDLKPERKSRKKKNNAINDTEKEHSEALLRAPDGLDSPLTKSAGQASGRLPTSLGSQTQEETQYLGPDPRHSDLKRKTSGESGEIDNARKKVKISLGPAVDLGD